jgi:hypothetical protein
MSRHPANPDCGEALEHGDDASVYPARACPRSTQLRAPNMLTPAKVREKDGKTLVRGLLREVRP